MRLATPQFEDAIEQAEVLCADRPTLLGFVKELLFFNACVESSDGRRKSARYSSYQKLVLEQGGLWESDLSLPDGIEKMPLGACYSNALDLSVDHDDLRYCEGYALASFISVPHAWCVRDDGVVVDPTWASLDFDGVREPVQYAGIVFDTDFHTSVAVETGYAAVIASDWRVQERALNHGFEMNDGVAYAYSN